MSEKFSFWRRVGKLPWIWRALMGLTILIALAYLPAFFAAFISDDFDYLAILFFNLRALVGGENWDAWFLKSINFYAYFRPFGHTLSLVDFLIGNLNPLIYHLTSVGMHVLATLSVYLLARRLTRRAHVAALAALIFALLPVHVSAVMWFAARYDTIVGFWFFLAIYFYATHRQRDDRRAYFLALLAFFFALLSKELALALPAIILLYDLWLEKKRLNFAGFVWRYAGIGATAIVYLALRFFFLRRVTERGLDFLGEGFGFWIDAIFVNAFHPFVSETNAELRVGLLFVVGLLAFALRARREILFGVAWIPVTYALTITTNASDYSFYLASFGVALVAASALDAWLAAKIPRALGVGAPVALIALYAAATLNGAGEYRRATEVAGAIVARVKELQPALAPDARLVFVGVPDKLPNDILVFRSGFASALALAYANPQLQIYRGERFPLWLDKRDRTFFFLVDHRRVLPRADITGALAQRARCASFEKTALEWKFARDAQGWEPWHQLADWRVENGALRARADGNDPYLGSPFFDVAALALGDIVITMRVRAAVPRLRAQIFWLTAAQTDFSPTLAADFDVQADGAWRTYRVNLAQTNKLFLDDRITRLRLDPVDAPAEIEIQSIQVLSHCSTLEGLRCECN